MLQDQKPEKPESDREDSDLSEVYVTSAVTRSSVLLMCSLTAGLQYAGVNTV